MRIALAQVPFSPPQFPALGLTQLRAVVQSSFANRVSVDIHYLSHDFVTFLSRDIGLDAGLRLHERLDDLVTGMGDWFFRQVAFPAQEDNSQQYFRRYYPGTSLARNQFLELALKKRGELDTFFDEMIDRHHLDGADIVGMASMYQQNVACFALARKIKQRNPAAIIVIGGANAETPMGEELVKRVASVDYVFSGPALVSFPQFVGSCLEGRREACSAIPGVFGKSPSVREDRDRVGAELDIDAEVPLDFDSYFESFEGNFGTSDLEPKVTFELSRGCWWGERSHCTFCGLNPTTIGYRSMSPARAIPFLEDLFERYASKTKCFHAVDNIMPKGYERDVFPHLKTPPGVRFYFEVKADLGQQEIAALGAAGVAELQPGIESLSTATLKLMKKGVNVFTNLRFLRNCLGSDVAVSWNLLIGLPGEEEESYRMHVDDLPHVVHFCPPVGVTAIRYDRYSPYFQRPEEYGLNLRHLEYYDFTYPFETESVEKLAYHFMDQNFGAPYVKNLVQWGGRVQETVRRWRESWEDPARRPRLCLEAREGAVKVVDSRSGTEIEHDVTGPRELLLDFLDRPKDAKSIEAFGRAQGFDALDELTFLEEQHLVWRENQRVMSIVLSAEYALKA